MAWAKKNLRDKVHINLEYSACCLSITADSWAETLWGPVVMLSSTLLSGHTPAHTQPLGFILWSHALPGNYTDETVPELGTGEEIRLSSTWSRETIRQNNSEITGRAEEKVLACPSFQVLMWDMWIFKPKFIPFLATLTCPRIHSHAYIEAGQIESLQQWKEHRQGLFLWSRPLRRIFRFCKDRQECLDLNRERVQHRSKLL